MWQDTKSLSKPDTALTDFVPEERWCLMISFLERDGKSSFWLFSCSFSKQLAPVPLLVQAVVLWVQSVQSWRRGWKASGPQRWRGWGQEGGGCQALVFVPSQATTHETSAPLRPETAASGPFKTTKTMHHWCIQISQKKKAYCPCDYYGDALQFYIRFHNNARLILN